MGSHWYVTGTLVNSQIQSPVFLDPLPSLEFRSLAPTWLGWLVDDSFRSLVRYRASEDHGTTWKLLKAAFRLRFPKCIFQWYFAKCIWLRMFSAFQFFLSICDLRYKNIYFVKVGYFVTWSKAVGRNLSVCVRALNSWHCQRSNFPRADIWNKMSGMVGREVQVLMNIDSSTNSTKRRRRPKGVNISSSLQIYKG